MRMAGAGRVCVVVLVAFGLAVYGLVGVDRAGVAVASTGPDLEVHKKLIGELTVGGSFAVGRAVAPSSVEIAGALLADGETRRAQLVHARGFDGAAWDWVGEDPAVGLPSTSLDGPWEAGGVTCPEHPSYDCYPGAATRVTKTGLVVAADGRVDIAVDSEYYISPVMHSTWGTRWHRYMEIFRPDGSACSWATGWSSNHPSPGWYEFPVTLHCQGGVGEPPDVGFVRLRLGRPNGFDSSQAWDFLFAGLEHEVNRARLLADGACVSRAGLRRQVTATSGEYVVGAAPPPMPALACMGQERLERFVVRRVPVAPAAFAEVTVLAWDGYTLFGEANATLTGAQMRAAAFPAGAWPIRSTRRQASCSSTSWT